MSLANPSQLTKSEWSHKAVEMAVMSLQLHFQAGKYYLEKASQTKNANKSIRYHNMSIERLYEASLFYFDSQEISKNDCVHSILPRVRLDVINPAKIANWCMALISLYGDEIGPTLKQIPYHLILFW